jgi:hypothetical protein
MELKIHIQRLTIEGGSPQASAEFADALRQQLAATVSRGAPLRSQRIDRIDAGTLPAASPANQQALRVAERVHGAWKGGRRG